MENMSLLDITEADFQRFLESHFLKVCPFFENHL